MNIRGFIRNFFGFSKAQTNGFLVLLPLTFLIIFSNPIYRYFQGTRTVDFSKEEKALASLEADFSNRIASKKREINQKPAIQTELFRFDPNTVSESELLRLGFQPFLAKRLINFREKGGKFFKKDDLLKLYGMDSALFNNIHPFVAITENIPETSLQTQKTWEKKPNKMVELVDLNQADSLQLVSVRGIGQVLATRLIKYREKLGGFYSMDQLYEVYGLDTAVVENLTARFYLPANPDISKIAINASTEEELATHPYIKKSIAKAIVAYRFQHGKFQSLSDLEKIRVVDTATLKKILPYLTIN